MAPKPKIIYVDWKDWERGQKFLTDQDTQVRVARAAIPIIFVPGIMGSRLRIAGGTRVWDPDDMIFMLKSFHNATGKAREDLLIKPTLEVDQKDGGGKPTFSFTERMRTNFSIQTPYASAPAPPYWDWLGISPDLPPDTRLDMTVSTLIEHGWDEISWDSYGGILMSLAEGAFSELNRCFIHPVYAFGYNWVDNNLTAGEKLAIRIEQIVQKENFANHPCDQVILVSHSMGGLVTRSCVINDGKAMGQVHGIIHGAQPATGAPAAYRRMRAGFEPPHSWNPLKNLIAIPSNATLGWDDARVVPILANCVGGLELLPTTFYKTNNADSQWLTLSDKKGKIVAELPYGNPYTDIYFSQSTKEHSLNKDEEFLQLILHPSMLAGSSNGSTQESRYAKSDPGLLKTFQGKLSLAQTFHNGLKLLVHPNTYVTYVGEEGLTTYDKVHFSYMREEHATHTYYSRAGSRTVQLPPEEQGTGIDLDENSPRDGTPEYFEIDPQDGRGDGTVPVSSGKSLIDANANVQANNASVRDDKGKLVSAKVDRVEHSQFFNDDSAVKFTHMAIRQLDWKYRYEKIKK